MQQNRKKLLILAKNAGLYLAKTAVASCVEAWIEMSLPCSLCLWLLSPPAWRRGLKFRKAVSVITSIPSPPAWRRGLKLVNPVVCCLVLSSPPAWRRGLKLVLCRTEIAFPASPPAWRRGLKFPDQAMRPDLPRSPPAWRRGLKFSVTKYIKQSLGRLLRGGVD